MLDKRINRVKLNQHHPTFQMTESTENQQTKQPLVPINFKTIVLNLALLLVGSIVFSYAWSYCLTPIFPNAPELPIGNLILFLLSFRLLVIATFGNIIQNVMDRLNFYTQAAEVINFNNTSQREAIIKLLNMINDKMEQQNKVLK